MLWFVGVALAPAGVGLYFAASSKRKEPGLMQGTQTPSAAELRSLAQSVVVTPRNLLEVI